MNESSVDRRILRTKKKLRTGLANLMQEKPLSEITIRELSAVSGVNRGTFYLHYSNIEDTVNDFYDDILFNLKSICDRHSNSQISSDPVLFFEEILQYFADNKDVCSFIFCPNTENVFLDKISSYLYDYFIERFKRKQGIAPINLKYAYTFMLSGTIGVIKSWYEEGMVISSNEIALLLKQLLRSSRQLLR